jgi:hypothetical protein
MAKKTTEKPNTAQGEIYIVVNPISYGEPEVRHETGTEVRDIPAESITWLLEQGYIKPKGGE